MSKETKVYIVQYPQPPIVVMPDGTWYATPTPYEMAQMIYDLRERVTKLEGAKE